MNRVGVGVRSLNIELQATLNPAGDRKVERFGWPIQRWIKRMGPQRMSGPSASRLNVRFTPKAAQILHCREMTRWAIQFTTD
jgi:hypothetical protein